MHRSLFTKILILYVENNENEKKKNVQKVESKQGCIGITWQEKWNQNFTQKDDPRNVTDFEFLKMTVTMLRGQESYRWNLYITSQSPKVSSWVLETQRDNQSFIRWAVMLFFRKDFKYDHVQNGMVVTLP